MMKAKFDSKNLIIQLCMKGMAFEESDYLNEAVKVFREA